MFSPLSRPDHAFRLLAGAEMVSWTLLLAGMAGKYLLGLGDLGVRVGGSIHGFVFLSYCLMTVLVAVDQRWRAGSTLLGLASSVVPYATIPFERHAARNGMLASRWRLLDDAPSGPVEAPVSAALRRPVAAVVVALVGVAGVFSALLAVGPPTQWFS